MKSEEKKILFKQAKTIFFFVSFFIFEILKIQRNLIVSCHLLNTVRVKLTDDGLLVYLAKHQANHL